MTVFAFFGRTGWYNLLSRRLTTSVGSQVSCISAVENKELSHVAISVLTMFAAVTFSEPTFNISLSALKQVNTFATYTLLLVGN